MRLALIYLDYHEYLIQKPQIINLGGQFIYSLEKTGNKVEVDRTLNEDYIEGFFDVTNLDSKLLNVNAIVGQNGAGKSSIFDSIRRLFIENPYALPSNNIYLFFETATGNELKTVSSIWDVDQETLSFVTRDDTFSINQERSNSKFKTIYYSPHFDYRYNPRFDNVDNYDISFDKVLQEDIRDLQNKTTAESSLNYSVNQELTFKNSLRQIAFLSSDLVSKDKIFKNLFDFPEFGEARLLINGYKVGGEWNTPRAFRPALKIIKEKLKKELDDWHLVRKFKSQSRVSNQIEVNKYLLKRHILRDVLSVLERQMEKQNHYLSEGEFSYTTFTRDSNHLDAYNSFLTFINNSKLKFGSDEIQPFLTIPISNLLEKLYSLIENISEEGKVETNVFFVSNEQAAIILKYQREFLINVINYYSSFIKKSKKINKGSLIDGFINYMPSRRRLSSGELALLNFYSRLYDFLFNRLGGETKSLDEAENYILLLDEADLGFHPIWKKKFVNSMAKTIPYFFSSLENSPTVQILFTTHDPLTLSDLPNKNIIYLRRNAITEETEVLEYSDSSHPNKSFAANITDLLADSFFVEDGLLGDFAKEKINKTIDWLRNKDDLNNSNYHKKIIQIIDEPIVQQKLSEMYSEKMEVDFSKEILTQQIESLKQKFKNQTGNEYDSL
ncbi:AAA family ATPase [Pricia sp. S334]|uniref:AAA family ATPase n=1 Tax=Pricia mediterranea TaxID=3076079 RepID=A0ABU3L504_9FLAO|nr:AAA family ATPase [Pricia sp. S334]MDT7828338.1 AAA family ATPase [Pricia sp. S334]